MLFSPFLKRRQQQQFIFHLISSSASDLSPTLVSPKKQSSSNAFAHFLLLFSRNLCVDDDVSCVIRCPPPANFLSSNLTFMKMSTAPSCLAAITRGRMLSTLINDESFRCTLLVMFPVVRVEALAYPELKTNRGVSLGKLLSSCR